MDNRYFMLCMLAVLLAICASVQAEPPGYKQGEAETTEGTRITSDIVYGHKFGMALTFDVYKPEQQNGAAVIFIVSGGWFSSWEEWKQFEQTSENKLRLITEEELVKKNPILPEFSFRPLLSKGFTVFAVRHGSSPKFGIPEIINDLRRAVRFIRIQSQEYGVDSKRIGVWGGSAGGHLSLLLCTTGDDVNPDAKDVFEQSSSHVAAVVAFFPPSELQRLFENMKPEVRKRYPALFLQAEQYKMYSPLHFTSPDDPPSLIIHGDQDTLVPIVEGRSMHQALLKSGAVSRFVTISGAEHGFVGEYANQALEEVVSWFVEHLGVK